MGTLPSRGCSQLFFHTKELENPVRVDRPNPNYAAAVLEQFGGA